MIADLQGTYGASGDDGDGDTAADITDRLDITEIQELAATIRAFQKKQGWSDAEMIRRYAGLGSTKTYKKIVDGDFKELDLDNQLAKYRSVHMLIVGSGDGASAEDLYDDLSPAVELTSAFLDVMKESGDARFVLVLGNSGMGKSSARKILIKKFGGRILWIEATEVWSDSPMAFLGEILLAMGKKNPPYQQVIRLRLVVAALLERRVCLIIDEGHHLGPRCLNTIKTLLNQTQGEFVVLALDTLWKKLEREAFEEARQLTGNRLALRIQLALRADDVKKILLRRVRWAEPADAERAAKLIVERAPRFGNLAFCREVCKSLNEKAAGDPAAFDLFVAALNQTGGTR